MKIAILGAGAIGSLLAAYFAKKDEQVVLISRHKDNCADTLLNLTVEGVRGRVAVTVPLKDRLDEAVDLTIIATKTQDLEKTLANNLTYLQQVPVLSVQNGVQAEELIGRKLNKQNIFSSIVMFGATYLAPGKVMHNFEGDWVLGKVDSGAKETLDKIRKVTAKIFPSPISADIVGMKWLKLFLNANNCLPAILNKSMQEAFKNISVCRISIKILREGWQVVNKAGIRLTSLPNFPVERISQLVSLPEDKAAGIFSNIMTALSREPLYGSVLQSIKRDRSSEIDYINGEFVRLAHAFSQDAPLNDKLVQMVHRVERNKQFLSEEELIAQTKAFVN